MGRGQERFFILCFTIIPYCLAEDDAIDSMMRDTSSFPYLTTDVSSRFSETNDTSGFAKKRYTVNGNNGKRSKDNIMQTINKKLPDLRYVYQKRLADFGNNKKKANSLKGKFEVRFSIISDGTVISCTQLESFLNDSLLEVLLLLQIYKWNFGVIPIKDDTSTVVYPFVFSQ